MRTNVAEIATLVHDYSMADVERFARIAVRKSMALPPDRSEREETAWHAIVLELYEATDPPTELELIVAGMNAVRAEGKAYLRHHGINRTTYEPAPVAAAYWTKVTTGVHDWTDSLTDHMALPQVLGVLTGVEYDALVALAAHGSITSAATSLGLSQRTVADQIKRARARIVEAWYAPDHGPAKSTCRDEACRNGHRRAEHSYRNGKGAWVCRRCSLRRYHAGKTDESLAAKAAVQRVYRERQETA